MFQNNGLSLEQAPPISVVLRFFLAGSVWGTGAGIWLALKGPESIDPSDFSALIMTHMLTLGVMLSFMFGSLFQMLPVLAGISFRHPEEMAVRAQYPVIAGTFLLISAFATSSGALYILAGLLLSAGILPVAASMLKRLYSLRDHSPSSRGIGFSVYNLLLLFSIGIWLAAIMGGWTRHGDLLVLRQLHLDLGLFGWISLLIISVSFQVIEMFYVTPPYPKVYARWLPLTVTGLLSLELAAALNFPAAIPWIESFVGGGLLIHSLQTLRKLSQRRRPLTDATVWFWRVGMATLAMSVFLLWSKHVFGLPPLMEELLYSMYTAFALSIVFAMTYKIVPFLVWFHLNAQGYFKAPLMHEVIHPRTAMRHLSIHMSTLLAAVAACFMPTLWHLTGILLFLSFFWISVVVYRAWHLYIHIRNTEKRFDFGGVSTAKSF